MIVYIDLDGVIADLDTQFKKYTGLTLKEKRDILHSQNNYSIYNFWKDFIDVKGFWSEIPKFEYSDLLVERTIEEHGIQNVRILSSPVKYIKICTTEKQRWVEKHYPYLKDKIHIVPRYLKKQFAKNNILIDDYKKNIDEWNKNNGIGIHHVTYKTTMLKLEIYKILESI